MLYFFRLSDNDLLGLVVELEHIDAGSGIQFDTADTVDLLGGDDAAGHVDDLEHAFTVDDEVVVADVSEVAVAVVAGGKHQFEAAFIVAGGGIEGVGGVDEEVNFGTGHVVDEVEVFEVHFLAGEVEGEAAVVFSLEVERHLTEAFNSCNSEVFAVDGHIDLGVVGVELHLGEVAAFEGHDGAVHEVAALGEVEGSIGALFARSLGEGDIFARGFSSHDDTFHGGDFFSSDMFNVGVVGGIQGVESSVNSGSHIEGVTHDVDTC